MCDESGSSWFHQIRDHKDGGCGQRGGGGGREGMLGRTLNADVRNL